MNPSATIMSKFISPTIALKVLLLPAVLIFISCSTPSSNTYVKEDTPSIEAPAQPPTSPKPAPTALIGLYHGVQDRYFLKNQFGDDLVINGRKVPVPSADHKFLLKEDGLVSLQQINLENNSRVYYEGTWTVQEESSNSWKVMCQMSDGELSSPTYLLIIDKAVGSAVCIGSSQPEFTLEKVDSNGAASSSSNPSQPVQELQPEGTYVYMDNSVEIRIQVTGDTWIGMTRIITGFGEDNDDQSVEYESGIVNGSDLYESTGTVRIGYVSGDRLTTTIGGQSVTLTRR
jgi:hypothetical protein